MAVSVDEIMNREIFGVHAEDDAERTLGYILMLRITAAPVLDAGGAAIGVVSFRDILAPGAGRTVGSVMSRPPITVPARASVEATAEILARANLHHAPVVDPDGQVIGMVSILDCTRALLGIPVEHPSGFPHYDSATGLVWTDDFELDLDHADLAPDGPGVLALVRGGTGRQERVAWGEACTNLRDRVHELIGVPEQPIPFLAALLEGGGVRFRASEVADREEREAALRVLFSTTGAAISPSRV